MVAFDNTILSILLFPDAVVNEGPDGKPVERAQDRVPWCRRSRTAESRC